MPKQLTKPQQLWVDALRSGEYKQTQYCLNHKTTYCCLGVACVVAAQHDVPVIVINDEIDGVSLRQQPAVQKWLGLKDTAGTFGNESDVDNLMHQNDGLRKTFAEIADVIEANADTLFED